MEKYGFIYLWYDRKRKMYYVGSHWGTIDDGYICSSNRMRDAYRRRPNDFKRRIIRSNVSRETLLDEEHKWLTKIKPEELGKKYYNLRQHKWGHWSTDINKRMTVGQKISEKNKGRKLCENHIKKISMSFKGKKHSVEARCKIKKARQHQIPPGLGKKHSEETKRKISENNSGIKSSQYGRIYTDKEREKKSMETKGVPRGPFSVEHKKKLSESAKNRWKIMLKEKNIERS